MKSELSEIIVNGKTLSVNRFYRFLTHSKAGPVWRGQSMAKPLYARIDSFVEGDEGQIYASTTLFDGSAISGYVCTGQTYLLLVQGHPEVVDFMPEDYIVYPYEVE